MSRNVGTSCYLKVKGKVDKQGTYNNGVWDPKVTGISVIGVTKGKPEKLLPGERVIKIKIYMPEEIFLPGIPEATIIVPVDMVDGAVEVSVLQP